MRMYMEFCLHRFIYTMVSWLHEGPMEEHVAVEFWSESGPPGKCLQTLSLQFSKIVDGCKPILSTRRPEASSASSQSKPKMAIRIAGEVRYVCAAVAP